MMEAHLHINAQMERAVQSDLPHGTAVVWTQRSPDKEDQQANEDSAAVISVAEGVTVLAVADGAGGMRAGADASRTAIMGIARTLEEWTEPASLRERILEAFDRVNRELIEAALGSGTTLAVALLQADCARFFHVGDSTIVAMGQRGLIRNQTIMHSPTGYAVESGLLDERAALLHEDRHLISNIVGTADMTVEMGPAIRLKPFDTILIASDGLFDNLHIEEVVEIARKGPLAQAVESLAGECVARMQSETPRQPSKLDDLAILAFRLRRGR